MKGGEGGAGLRPFLDNVQKKDVFFSDDFPKCIGPEKTILTWRSYAVFLYFYISKSAPPPGHVYELSLTREDTAVSYICQEVGIHLPFYLK